MPERSEAKAISPCKSVNTTTVAVGVGVIPGNGANVAVASSVTGTTVAVGGMRVSSTTPPSTSVAVASSDKFSVAVTVGLLAMEIIPEFSCKPNHKATTTIAKPPTTIKKRLSFCMRIRRRRTEETPEISEASAGFDNTCSPAAIDATTSGGGGTIVASPVSIRRRVVLLAESKACLNSSADW